MKDYPRLNPDWLGNIQAMQRELAAAAQKEVLRLSEASSCPLPDQQELVRHIERQYLGLMLFQELEVVADRLDNVANEIDRKDVQ